MAPPENELPLMPAFGQRSQDRLAECHEDLRRLFVAVVEHYDCTILQGHRGEAAQMEAFETGKSKLPWDLSKHNKVPSLAVDAAPWPVDWDNLEAFRTFGGFVLGTAVALGITIRWGGDWDGDWTFTDQRFHDLPHFELVW